MAEPELAQQRTLDERRRREHGVCPLRVLSHHRERRLRRLDRAARALLGIPPRVPREQRGPVAVLAGRSYDGVDLLVFPLGPPEIEDQARQSVSPGFAYGVRYLIAPERAARSGHLKTIPDESNTPRSKRWPSRSARLPVASPTKRASSRRSATFEPMSSSYPMPTWPPNLK